MWIYKLLITLTAMSLLPISGQSAQMKLLKKQDKAYFAEDDNGFFKGLSLKTKEYRLNSRDALRCGSSLKRNIETLEYFCSIDLPKSDHVTKLHKQVSVHTVKISHGRLKKVVEIRVDESGKSVKFSTSFDDTGFDWDVSKFNDEFYAVYAKSAQSIFANAMKKAPLTVQTIESK